MNLSLKGKNALIAGSSHGIGLAIAKELAILGTNCTLIARNEQALLTAIESLPKEDLVQKHQYLVLDFDDYQKVQEVISAHVAKHPTTILINNTGGPKAGPIFEAEANDFLLAFKRHLICNQLITQAVVPAMKELKFGRIVNIISTSVRIPIKNLGVSNTIRGAVASWAKTMSNELAPFGITVNNILPGFTKTDRLEQIIETRAKKRNTDRTNIESEMIKTVPMNRFGAPEEIAQVAAFLCTPATSYLTGVSIPVDGGRTGSI